MNCQFETPHAVSLCRKTEVQMGDGLKFRLQIRHQSVVLSKLISFQAMTKEVCLPSMGVVEYENELLGDSQAGPGVHVSSGCRVVASVDGMDLMGQERRSSDLERD